MRWRERERASGVQMSEGCHGSSDWTSFAFGKSPGLLSPLDNLERPSHAGVDLILTANVVRPDRASGDTEKVQRLLDHPFDNTSQFCVLLKTVSLRKVKIVVFKEEMNLKVYMALLLPALRRLYVPLFIFILVNRLELRNFWTDFDSYFI